MRGRRAHVARGRKANLAYGFIAGALFACFVVIGLLLTNAGIDRFENIPLDAPPSAQRPTPIVRDSYSAVEHKGNKISAAGKSSPPLTPRSTKKPKPTVTGATGTATKPPTRSSTPPAGGTTPTPVPQPVKTKPPITIVIPPLLPLLPGVKVTVPPLLPSR